jgi:hypothetical protein
MLEWNHSAFAGESVTQWGLRNAVLNFAVSQTTLLQTHLPVGQARAPPVAKMFLFVSRKDGL